MPDTKAQFDQTTRLVKALLRELDEPKASKGRKKKKHRFDPEEAADLESVQTPCEVGSGRLTSNLKRHVRRLRAGIFDQHVGIPAGPALQVVAVLDPLPP